MKKRSTVQNMAFAGLFAALVCVMTLVVRIPSPTGYTNLGDCMILLGAFVLGPVWGFAAGGIGSMIADLLAGYASYAPATFLVKGCIALIAALLCRAFQKHGKLNVPARILSCTVGELFMVAGYLVFETWIMGYGAAALESVPGNLMQGLVGIVLGIVLYRLLAKTPILKEGSGF